MIGMRLSMNASALNLQNFLEGFLSAPLKAIERGFGGADRRDVPLP